MDASFTTAQRRAKAIFTNSVKNKLLLSKKKISSAFFQNGLSPVTVEKGQGAVFTTPNEIQFKNLFYEETIPGRPDINSLVNGDSFFIITWTPNPYIGGSDIISFKVLLQPGNVKKIVISKPDYSGSYNLTFNNLINGNPYTITVISTNKFGDSDPSISSAVPSTVPDSPREFRAEPGIGELFVSWVFPLWNGGSPVTGYIIYYRDDIDIEGEKHINDRFTLNTVLSNLKKNNLYTISIISTNKNGNSFPTTIIVGTLTDIPNSPFEVNAIKSDDQTITISWKPAINCATSSSHSYKVISHKGDTLVHTTECSAKINCLSTTNEHTYSVIAINCSGHSQPSVPIKISYTGPSEPTDIYCLGGNSSVEVHWNKPKNDGGLPITYKLITEPEDLIIESSTSPQTFTGLTKGATYKIHILAINDVGTCSSYVSVTIPNYPDAPKDLKAFWNDDHFLATWENAFDGGSPIISHTIKYTGYDNKFSVKTKSPTNSFILKGPKKGIYTFTVVATNKIGDSQSSCPFIIAE